MRKGIGSQHEVAIHTSDRNTFRNCRRKWDLSSPLRQHLRKYHDTQDINSKLWFGRAIHFALEDYHGYQRFAHPMEAYKAYELANHPEIPEDACDLCEIAAGMLNVYLDSIQAPEYNLKTVYIDGKPLVEYSFSLILEQLCHYTFEDEQYFNMKIANTDDDLYVSRSGKILDETAIDLNQPEYTEVVYHGTVDKVVEDEYGNWWIVDYKTAEAFNTTKLPLDPQISAYCWALEQYLEHPIEGMMYIQLSKKPPHPPKVTKRGISTDKRQRTTPAMYKEALIDYYGSLAETPEAQLDMLDYLHQQKSPFIQIDFVERNRTQKAFTYQYIRQEGKEMLNPQIPIYPNPTWNCIQMCQFADVCKAMERGDDWKTILLETTEKKETTDEEPQWKKNLYRLYPKQYPNEFKKYYGDMDNVDEFLESLKEEKKDE